MDCVVHFLRLLAVCQAHKVHLLACNVAKYSLIFNFFTDRLSNKPFLIWGPIYKRSYEERKAFLGTIHSQKL